MTANTHPTVTVELSDGYTAEIDTLMADLIRECWRLGIETQECCQESARGVARIGFMSLTDMEVFYDVASASDTDESLFFSWKWELWADGGLRGTVHFPASEIDWLTERFAARKFRAEER